MDPRKNYTVEARARVKVVLEFVVGTWGSECPMDQVFDQASKIAIDKIRTALPKEDPRTFQIIGEPVVEAVFTQKAR